MACAKGFLGCQDDVICILRLRDKLNEQAMEHVNRSQELMLTSMFMQESNEYRYRTTLMERLADVESWRWVLSDLSKRLAESLQRLEHERESLTVVVGRVADEIRTHCKEASMPGALEPFSDDVEKAIVQECKYLCRQKKEFTSLLNELQSIIVSTEKVKKRIDRDITNKERAIHIDERTLKGDLDDHFGENRNKTSATPLSKWERHCQTLKQAGLRALCSAAVARQQVRGARVQLSVESQAHAARVDAVLRRRLHVNQRKVEELEWQRQEIERDIEALDNEVETNQDSLAENERHIKKIEARIAERTLRPQLEHIMDQAQETLKTELTTLRKNGKALIENMNEIAELKQQYCNMLIRIEDAMSDVSQVVALDSARVAGRQSPANDPGNKEPSTSYGLKASDEPLPIIVEEQEDTGQ